MTIAWLRRRCPSEVFGAFGQVVLVVTVEPHKGHVCDVCATTWTP